MDRFRKAIDDNGLIDFGEPKAEMTWHGKGIMERLDRAMCNKEWLDQFPQAKVVVLDWLCSDHRPILVCYQARDSTEKCGRITRNTRFHFEEAWSEDKHCAEIIEAS